MEEAAEKAAMEEYRRKRTQADLQNRYQLDLEREKMVTGPLIVDANSEETLKYMRQNPLCHPWHLQHPMCVCLIQVRQQMEKQMAQKSSELEQYLQRVKELEDMYHQLEEALEDERQAKLDEEAMRKLQARCTNGLLSPWFWFHLSDTNGVCVCVYVCVL